MLTLFTVPKPFEGHIGIIQRNAIESWIRLGAGVQIVLCGDEAGSAETARRLGVEIIPDIARNEFGTPLLSSAFGEAERRARHPLVGYVNADILLLSDFAAAAAALASRKSRFLMVGQRWDLDVTEPLSFAGGWEGALRARARAEGRLHPPAGSDYFVYPRGAIGRLPDFAVGRPTWDNWMIYRARRLRLPVVDVSAVTCVVHQNHGYAHVRDATGPDWEGPEAERNRALVGGRERIFTLADATYRLTPAGLAPSLGRADVARRLRSLEALHPPLRPLYAAARRLLVRHPGGQGPQRRDRRAGGE